MPFPQIPPGFSRDALRLLDIAMTRAWMERVAIGASESGADAKLCATLWGKVDRLEKLQSGERGGIRKDFAKHMAAHRFKVGQRVIDQNERVAEQRLARGIVDRSTTRSSTNTGSSCTTAASRTC